MQAGWLLNFFKFSIVRPHTRFPQKLALGLSVEKGLLHKINLTTFIRPWSYQWGHGLISGVGNNAHYAVKMPNSYISYNTG